jgi:hypothetical protein
MLESLIITSSPRSTNSDPLGLSYAKTRVVYVTADAATWRGREEREVEVAMGDVLDNEGLRSVNV